MEPLRADHRVFAPSMRRCTFLRALTPGTIVMAVGGGEYVLADGIASRPARSSVKGASSSPYTRIRQLRGLGSPGSPPIGRIRARPTGCTQTATRRGWTYFADAYAVGLLALATSGLFMITGRKGLFGRGIFFVARGRRSTRLPGRGAVVTRRKSWSSRRRIVAEARHELPSGTGSTASGGMPIAKMRSRAADRKKSTARE
jgi:hypothetical protein